MRSDCAEAIAALRALGDPVATEWHGPVTTEWQGRRFDGGIKSGLLQPKRLIKGGIPSFRPSFLPFFFPSLLPSFLPSPEN